MAGKGCCGSMMQCVLTVINLLTLVVGAVVAVVGVLLYLQHNGYFPELDDYNLSLSPVAIAIIIIGGLLLLIGLFGCCGAITGSRGMLNIYFVFILIIVILEILVIIFGFLSKASVEAQTREAFGSIFKKFNNGTGNDIELAAVTTLQMNLQCCGFDGPDFWTNATMFSGNKVPGSCCEGYDIETSDPLCDETDAYTDGCEQVAIGMMNTFKLVFFIVLLVSILCQFFCMIIACYIKKRDLVA